MAAKKVTKVTIDAAAAEDVARKIWLAGVGAYGRMFAEAQDKVGKAAGTANELFEQLVARGEVLEDAVRERLEASDATKKVAGVIGKLQDYRTEQRAALKARVETIRKAVDHANPLALSKQVEELSARLAALEGKAGKALKAAKRAPAKPVVVKTATRAAAKRVSTKKAAKR